VAAPVRNSRGAVIYAISVAGAASRLNDEKVNRVIPLLLKAARDIHAQLH